MDLRRRHNLGADIFGQAALSQTVTIEFDPASDSADGTKVGQKNVTAIIHTSDAQPLQAQVSADIIRSGGDAVNLVDIEFTSPSGILFNINDPDGSTISLPIDILGAGNSVTALFGFSNVVGATPSGNTTFTLSVIGGGGGA